MGQKAEPVIPRRPIRGHIMITLGGGKLLGYLWVQRDVITKSMCPCFSNISIKMNRNQWDKWLSFLRGTITRGARWQEVVC